MKLGYLSIGSAGLTVVLSAVLSFVSLHSAQVRSEIVDFDRLTESIQAQLVTKRQLLQSQQEKLNKGSAIAESVGPAVLADIKNYAEKTNNSRLKDLLLKHGVHEVQAASPKRPN